MIADFEDFCLWIFVIVDDSWKEIAPFCVQPEPKSECTDSELMAITCESGLRPFVALVPWKKVSSDQFPVTSVSEKGRRICSFARD